MRFVYLQGPNGRTRILATEEMFIEALHAAFALGLSVELRRSPNGA